MRLTVPARCAMADRRAGCQINPVKVKLAASGKGVHIEA
ncbi:hypothetical protein CWT02_1534 [Salmonella enterica subsp. enterica serovar Cubana]|nr:hypothetical protein CWT02_1534 [Salmonella enterica subsp. enterica serovar Cubana]